MKFPDPRRTKHEQLNTIPVVLTCNKRVQSCSSCLSGNRSIWSTRSPVPSQPGHACPPGCLTINHNIYEAAGHPVLLVHLQPWSQATQSTGPPVPSQPGPPMERSTRLLHNKYKAAGHPVQLVHLQPRSQATQSIWSTCTPAAWSTYGGPPDCSTTNMRL